MSNEIELKYSFFAPHRADDILNDPFFSPFKTQLNTICMDCTYYDTTDHLLSKQRIALRLRKENHVPVVTLKTRGEVSGALSSRGEWQVEADSIDLAFPKLKAIGVSKAIIEMIQNKPLIIVAEFQFTRQSTVIEISKNLVVELCIDIGFLGNENRTIPFNEVEFELISGTKEELLSFGERFCTHFHAYPEHRSKLVRALDVS